MPQYAHDFFLNPTHPQISYTGPAADENSISNNLRADIWLVENADLSHPRNVFFEQHWLGSAPHVAKSSVYDVFGLGHAN
ncbi:hypothetical protein RRF57_005969 [Xylaria bambusicola]|uniref:Uncharacterized protein n=1 Tax=Xylaria bambusicola TaxID=326684 RepID=A0AAN7URE8_9PEZI